MNKSSIHKVLKNKGLTFQMGQVSELQRKAIVNNSHDLNLSNCSVAFKNVITVLAKEK